MCTINKQDIKKVALEIALRHHLSDFSGTDPLEVFEEMNEDNVEIWEPFQYYPLQEIEEFISNLAFDIEEKINRLIEENQ